MGLQISLGLQQQLIVLIVSLSPGLHPFPLGPSSFSTRGLCPFPLRPSSFSTWDFSLYLASFRILIKDKDSSWKVSNALMTVVFPQTIWRMNNIYSLLAQKPNNIGNVQIFGVWWLLKCTQLRVSTSWYSSSLKTEMKSETKNSYGPIEHLEKQKQDDLGKHWSTPAYRSDTCHEIFLRAEFGQIEVSSHDK